MKKVPLTLGIFLAGLGMTGTLLTSQDHPTKQTLMRAKAGYAHRLLDAVVQENFDVMEDQAFPRVIESTTSSGYRSRAGHGIQRTLDVMAFAIDASP